MIGALLLLACSRGAGPQVSAGEGALCAVYSRGQLGCYGEELTLLDSPRGNYRQVSLGDATACALSDGGNLSCWGESFELTTSTPAGYFLSISLGNSHACALSGDGSIRCWGDDNRGQAQAPPLSYLAVDVGGDVSCAILQNDSLACWGDSSLGTPPEGRFVSLDVGDGEACAIDSEGALACWPNPAIAFVELQTEGLKAVSVGPDTLCTLSADGQASCVSRATNAALTPPAYTFTAIAGGQGYACGFVDGKDLVCWGDESAFLDQTKTYDPRGKDQSADWQDTGDLGEG